MRKSIVSLVAGMATFFVLPAHAVGVSLDGSRRTTHSSSGDLDDSVLLTSGNAGSTAADPGPADCRASSCSMTEYALTLPADRLTGRFTYEVRITGRPVEQATASFVKVAMYDAADKLLTEGRAEYGAGGEVVRLAVPRLPRGAYRLRIYNRGAPMHFDAKATWVANPPPRPAR